MKGLPPKGSGGAGVSSRSPNPGLEARDFFQPRLAATSCHSRVAQLS